MIERVTCDQLEPGMFTVDTGVDWRQEPYAYCRNQVLDEAAIHALREEGYLYAFVDTGRSIKPSDEMVMSITPLKADIPLQEELVVAQASYTASLDAARGFMDAVRNGDEVDCSVAEPAVHSIMESLGRNPDALYGISKLRNADDYTYSHCVNVSVLSTMFAKYLGFSEKTQYDVGMAAMLHDLGKSLIPLSILNAPRKLTDEEFEIMRSHSYLGYAQLQRVESFSEDMRLGVLQHHERYDGTGYPGRLAGDQISPIARILAVVDVYDALTSKRVYKKKLPSHQVLAMMFQRRGQDFYPGLAEHYAKMIGIYPVGSVVELKNGLVGVVSASNPEKPTKPAVTLVQDNQGRAFAPKEINLADYKDLDVKRCLLPEETRIDPQEVLGIQDNA